LPATDDVVHPHVVLPWIWTR